MPGPKQRTRLSADVGGTFTDVAVFDEAAGALRLGKTLTTPRRLVEGIAAGVDKAASSFAEASLFLHGTTIAINTILERSGARVILLTTQGFRDIYEIGRVNRPESYNLFFQKHVPLIERARRHEIRERTDADGRILIPVDEDQVQAIVDAAVADGVEAVAILFLHSYRNPAHERRVKELIEAAHSGLFVTASHELSQEYREFERTVDGSVALDRAATAARRAAMRAAGLPLAPPDEPPAPAEPHPHHDHHHGHEHLSEEERLVVALSNRCCS